MGIPIADIFLCSEVVAFLSYDQINMATDKRSDENDDKPKQFAIARQPAVPYTMDQAIDVEYGRKKDRYY